MNIEQETNRNFLGDLRQEVADFSTIEFKPVIRVFQTSIVVSEFRVLDSKREFSMHFAGGILGLESFSALLLSGAEFGYLYAVSNGEETKIVISSVFGNPVGYQYARRLACLPTSGFFFIEGMQYNRTFYFNKALEVYPMSTIYSGNFNVTLKYVPSVVSACVRLQGCFYATGSGGNRKLRLNGALVGFIYNLAQTFYYPALTSNGVLACNLDTSSASLSLDVYGFEDVTL